MRFLWIKLSPSKQNIDALHPSLQYLKDGQRELELYALKGDIPKGETIHNKRRQKRITVKII